MLQHPKLLEKSEIFRLSEILRRRSEIFVTYLYKNALFHMNMSLSGVCTSFGKVTLFSVPEVFCGPQICQICQKCVDGSAPDPARHATSPFPVPLSTHNSILKYFSRKFSNCSTPPDLQYAYGGRSVQLRTRTLLTDAHARDECQ